MKKIVSILLSCFVFLFPMQSYASGWQGNAEKGWWYGTNAENSTWYQDGWHWIDGNHDGIAECYYFDDAGWLLTSTTTPDGYTVDEDGAWYIGDPIENRQVKEVEIQYEQAELDAKEKKKAKVVVPEKKNGVMKNYKPRAVQGNGATPKSGEGNAADFAREHAN